MKKKFSALLLAFAFCSSVFAEISYRFYNKLYSDTMNIRHVDSDYLGIDEINFKGKDESYTDCEFFGIYNKVYAEFKTDKTDAMVKATIGFDDWSGDSDYGFRWTGYVDDWFVEYRPWDFVTLGFHDSIYMDGSYLPIYDDNLYSGNIGSEGFTLVYRPSMLDYALRIAATVPFTITENWVHADEDDDNIEVYDDKFNLGLGAIYTDEYFQVGANLQDVFDNDERRFGTYVNFPSLFGLCKELTVGGGYSYSKGGAVYDFNRSTTFDDYTYFGGVNGKNLFSSYFTYNGKFVVNGEIVWNFNNDDVHFYYDSAKGDIDMIEFGWNLYTAASVKFWITKILSAEVVGKLVADTSSSNGYDLDNIYAGEFKLNIDLTQHSEVEAGASVDYFDGNYKICFPCYWKYTF